MFFAIWFHVLYLYVMSIVYVWNSKANCCIVLVIILQYTLWTKQASHENDVIFC